MFKCFLVDQNSSLIPVGLLCENVYLYCYQMQRKLSPAIY